VSTLDNLLSGFAVAMNPTSLLCVFIGVLLGTIIGVLPGLGPTATIALLLPITYGMDPTNAIVMLAGVYYGSMYGGTITSVLLHLPGESSSVVTTFDGHPMARQGRAGPALGIAAIGSFVGGVLATAGLIWLAPPLAEIAVTFGPPEFAAIAVLGILLVSSLGMMSTQKAVISALAGLFLATVGQDPVTGGARFTFGSLNLLDGLDLVAIVMGLFGIGEVLYHLDSREKADALTAPPGIRHIIPTKDDFRRSALPVARGSMLGLGLGVLPGGGGIISSLSSYALEKRIAKDPQRFGKGAIEGVAGPETANNAGATSAFIPLLTLGIPSNVVLALIFGALLIHGITPGPQLVVQHPEMFWGVIASMLIGNVMLLILNMPMVGLFTQILRVPMDVLAPLIVFITMIGVYSVNNNPFDMWVALVFGVIGYLMRKTGFEPGPLVLAFVLGDLLETSVRQSLLISEGTPAIFVTRPVSGGILAVVVLVVVMSAVRNLRPGRRPGRRRPAPSDVLSSEEQR
jgi:putative tricarboxylic transport membrane protein